MEDIDLREVRALAACIYPSLAAHGHAIDACVEQALEVAEKLVARSEAREQARRDVEERAAANGNAPAGRTMLPQRTAVRP